MKHSDYITHIKNEEDIVYLKTKHFPVNMRLFETSLAYRDIITAQCNYLTVLCSTEKEGYKKPHGMSSANAGLSFNIIALLRDRNKVSEYCQVMINPVIINLAGDEVETLSNCGSLTLSEPIKCIRHELVQVEWFDIDGNSHREWFGRKDGSFTIQHEIDHNNGILITDL